MNKEKIKLPNDQEAEVSKSEILKDGTFYCHLIGAQKIKTKVGDLICNGDIYFYKNENLKKIELEDDIILNIQGFSYNVKNEIFFHENGKIEKIFLTHELDLGNRFSSEKKEEDNLCSYIAKRFILFDEQENIIYWE